MLEKVLPMIGGIFAAIGFIIIFYDVITSIKNRNKFKTSIAGLVVLIVAVAGYFTTDILELVSGWPAMASLIWIALFWVYVVLSLVVALDQAKQQRRAKEAVAATEAEESSATQETTAAATATPSKSVKPQQNGKNKKSQNKQQRKVVIVKKGCYTNKR